MSKMKFDINNVLTMSIEKFCQFGKENVSSIRELKKKTCVQQGMVIGNEQICMHDGLKQSTELL